ncbi:hypothetical protein BDM02DRAFT_1413159 [Thelephora ganbajun]|uniref:Uncharacterized protein n=1 Tax=Thelephora ganbajun TaxID=370292 RepID=A0ACB6Z1H5_THEGA|nr:hypothetical protein BDM02DRAFT_1413159 [Thelephora ganbajun]
MSTKNDTTRMPPNGSYPVNVGSSLTGALKANKGLPQAPKLSDRGFYSFRYNFKPESIDLYKPGTIEVKKEGDRKTATIERASIVPREGQLFTGAEIAAKDVECVLVYDEELGTFTLEKLDSLINVTWGGKSIMPSNRPFESLALTVSSAPVSPTKKEHDPELDLTAELERDLLSVIEDAPPKRSSTKQESSSLKASTSSTPNSTPGLQSLLKKPMVKREQKSKAKEPAPIFMNPNSAAARVTNKKSAPPKQEPQPEPKFEEKSPALSLPTPMSKLAKLAGDLKSKGVKRGAEPGAEESAKVPKRPLNHLRWLLGSLQNHRLRQYLHDHGLSQSPNHLQRKASTWNYLLALPLRLCRRIPCSQAVAEGLHRRCRRDLLLLEPSNPHRPRLLSRLP